MDGAPKTRKSFETELERSIGRAEMAKLSRGYDLLGNIAIIDFAGGIRDCRKIAAALMRHNKSISTVLAKAGAVSGRYRIRKLKYVAGKRNYMAVHRENNCTFRFDVRKVYFSNRLSFERSRIIKLVRENENVMVMFAGTGPFAIEIAKSVKGTRVVAIELNKSAYVHMLENIALNKTPNVDAILGDVKRVCGKYRSFADRIIMPLPMSSTDYLDCVAAVAKRRASVHIYALASISSGGEDVKKIVRGHALANNYKVRFTGIRTVRPYSSKQAEMVLDYSISK
ncbi:MAG: hypothetical protein KGI06_04290 [Candidatus Micrarchaeota archaeon]|nr:hypothetical protein [Candidatus Micrarchaeota archaeon]